MKQQKKSNNKKIVKEKEISKKEKSEKFGNEKSTKISTKLTEIIKNNLKKKKK
jgi:hypothetical protein